MSTNSKLLAVLFGSVSAMALASSSAEAGGGGGIDAVFPGTLAPITLNCQGKTVSAATLTPPLGQPAATQVDGLTQANVFCQNTIQIPGNHRLTSFDISWVDPVKALYFLADRSNDGIDVINTANNTFHARLGAGTFAGIHFVNPTSIDNNISGPNGVVSHGNWVYAGDGDSTLKVFNIAHLNAWPGVNAAAQAPIPTGGATRLDEMELDSRWLHSDRRQQCGRSSLRDAVHGELRQSDLGRNPDCPGVRRCNDHARGRWSVAGAAALGSPEREVCRWRPAHQ